MSTSPESRKQSPQQEELEKTPAANDKSKPDDSDSSVFPTSEHGTKPNAAVNPLGTPGSSSPPFEALEEPQQTTYFMTLYYQSITCMIPYSHLSFEEIRVQDYAQGRREFIPALAVPTPPSQGSLHPLYQAYQERDPNIPKVHITLYYQSISCMHEYRHLSCEEIRLQDYAQGRKPVTPKWTAFSQVHHASTPRQSQTFDCLAKLAAAAVTLPTTFVTQEAISKMGNMKLSANRTQMRTGVLSDLGLFKVKSFSYPRCFLPPSFHEYTMVGASEWLKIYQETIDHEGDGADRLRLLDAWHIPVCGLFQGRVIDRPQSHLPNVKYMPGKAVKHQVHMFAGIILLVVELKVTPQRSESHHITEIVLELTLARLFNEGQCLFEKKPAIFALLTDLEKFEIYSYDGKSIRKAQAISVSSQSGLDFMRGMIPVTDMIFSILLEGYVSTLRAVVSNSKVGSESRSLAKSQSVQSTGVPRLRPSIEECTNALAKAEEAQKVLQESSRTSRKAAEDQGQRGLELLTESVKILPKLRHIMEEWDEKGIEDVAKNITDDIFDAP